ncbi:MAG: dihydrodipicolinate reductase [Pseudomonadota bacterium]
MRVGVYAIIAVLIAGPAMAEFKRVNDRDNFVSLVKDRSLTRLGIRLNVSDNGQISGRAFGRKVSGAWSWSSGYFCRDLYVNGNMLDGDNCQKVEVRGDTLRFTSDKGTGDTADLRLR